MRVRATAAEAGTAAMKPPSDNDLDFLGALLHGRRSRLVEERRLEALCRLQSLPELGFTVYPDAGHDSWTQTYDDRELYKWLLSQRRK